MSETNKASGVITPGEISVGDKLTVLCWQSHESIVPDGGFLSTKTITIQDRSYCGDVLEVVAVELPYIAIKNLSEWSAEWRTHISKIDTSRCTLKLLSPEYAAAMTRK